MMWSPMMAASRQCMCWGRRGGVLGFRGLEGIEVSGPRQPPRRLHAPTGSCTRQRGIGNEGGEGGRGGASCWVGARGASGQQAAQRVRVRGGVGGGGRRGCALPAEGVAFLGCMQLAQSWALGLLSRP